MTVNAAVIELLKEAIGDEIKVCEFEDYYEGNPQTTSRVRDIVKENGNILLLI